MDVYYAEDGKLQEQLSAVRKEITRLEYQNNELDQVRAHPLASDLVIVITIMLPEIRSLAGRGNKVLALYDNGGST